MAGGGLVVGGGQDQAVDANGSCWAVLFPAVGQISSAPAWPGLVEG